MIVYIPAEVPLSGLQEPAHRRGYYDVGDRGHEGERKRDAPLNDCMLGTRLRQVHNAPLTVIEDSFPNSFILMLTSQRVS